jgi:hypothetical protein
MILICVVVSIIRSPYWYWGATGSYEPGGFFCFDNLNPDFIPLTFSQLNGNIKRNLIWIHSELRAC